MDCAPAERAAQLPDCISIAHKEEAELGQLIGSCFAFQDFRLVKRVVPAPAISHLLRLDVHLVDYCAAIVVHSANAAAGV